MDGEDRRRLVTLLVRDFDDCDEQQANPTEGWLNEHGEWLTWEDMNPGYIDSGAARCCDVCKEPMRRGWVAEDGMYWCSPACLWGDDDLESLLMDFNPDVLGETLYYTEWDDEEAEDYAFFRGGKTQRVAYAVTFIFSGIPEMSLFSTARKAYLHWVDNEAPPEMFNEGYWSDGDDVEARYERVVID